MIHHQVHLAAAAAIRAHVAAFEDVLKGIDPDQYLCSEENLREEAISRAGNHHVNFIRQDMTQLVFPSDGAEKWFLCLGTSEKFVS